MLSKPNVIFSVTGTESMRDELDKLAKEHKVHRTDIVRAILIGALDNPSVLQEAMASL